MTHTAGAEVTIAHGGTLTLETIKTLLQSFSQTPVMKNIKNHVAKMSDQLYHVYFTASNANGDYKEASERFKAKFKKGKMVMLVMVVTVEDRVGML